MRLPLVVCALVMVIAACTDETSPHSTSEPTPTTGSGANSTPGPTTDARRDALDGLPTGPPPRISYADGGDIIHPDGRRETLPGQRRIGVSAFTSYRSGYLVADTRFFEGTVGLAYVRGRKRTDLGPCASGGVVVSGDGQDVAWMTQGCPESGLIAPTLVHVAPVTGAGEEQREISRIGIVGVAGFVDDSIVVSGYHEGVQLVGPGRTTQRVPHLETTGDAAGGRGLVAGVLPDGDAHGAVVDVRTGELLWQRRHTYPGVFSPDGSLLAGYYERQPALIDAATGRVVTMVHAPDMAIHDLVWEDDRHLLAVAHDRHHQALVRVGLHGLVTRVGPVVPEEGYRYVFETRP